MLVVDRVVGNRYADPGLEAVCQRAAESGSLEQVELSFEDAGRGRLRITTDAGTELGVNIGRGNGLRDGDVLYRSPDGRRVVAVAVHPMEALSIRVATPRRPRQESEDTHDLFELGVRLGHLLGNQHWAMGLHKGAVLVPVTVDRLVMETVLRTHGLRPAGSRGSRWGLGLAGLEYEFVPVDPAQVPLAASAPPHSHG